MSQARYPAMVAGFGAGKTEALIIRRVVQALRYPKNTFAFYEPTYDLIRQIAWPRFEEILTRLCIPYRLFKSPTNELHIEGGAKIIFRSMDTPHRIIGYQVADSDVDELDTLKRDDAAKIWTKALERNRQKKHDGSPNTIAVATTPEGFRFVYERWVKQKHDDYQIIKAPTRSNLYNLPEGYIESLQEVYPDNLLQAYLEGEFVNLTSGTVYTGFDRDRCDTNESIQSNEPLYIGMDFNVGEMSAVVGVLREGNLHCVSEITQGYDTPHMINLIKDKYTDHAIYVYPDASGNSRKSNDAGKTDIKLLQQAGFRVRAKSKNPPVKDRINDVNQLFNNQKGFVNVSTCPELTRCLEQQAYNKHGEPDKDQGLDHLTDALGYLVTYDFGINKPNTQVLRGLL